MEIFTLKLDKDYIRLKFNEILSYVSEEKKYRINNFRNFDDVCRIMSADILIRSILCNKTKTHNSSLLFSTNDYGKPYLKGNYVIDYNISHSAEWVVCGICEGKIGIDVEKIEPISLDIAKSFFTNNEYLDLLSIEGTKRIDFFYELWTLKESYIKAVGAGINISFNSFSIKIQDEIISFESNDDKKKYLFGKFYVDNGYKAAFCSTSFEPYKIVTLRFDEMFEEFIASKFAK